MNLPEPKSYQHALLNKIQAGGFNTGEMMIFTAGRRTGKSMLNQMYGSMMTLAKFSITDQAQVDGATWYTITCTKDVSAWLRDQPRELQYLHQDLSWDPGWAIFADKVDIHEKLYTMLALKWS